MKVLLVLGFIIVANVVPNKGAGLCSDDLFARVKPIADDCKEAAKCNDCMEKAMKDVKKGEEKSCKVVGYFLKCSKEANCSSGYQDAASHFCNYNFTHTCGASSAASSLAALVLALFALCAWQHK